MSDNSTFDTSALRAPGFVAFLATQFLGAFNDNVFKFLIIFSAIKTLEDANAERFYVALAAASLTIPFLLFSSFAGFLADRFSKKRIMIRVKVAEIVIMSLGVVAFRAGSLPLLLGVLFLMGAQSAFFGPAKYGFMPDTLPDELLSRGNGVLQLWTLVAVILGGAVAGILSQVFADRTYLAALFCVVVAVAGTGSSLFITSTRPMAPERRFRLSRLTEVFHTLREITGQSLLMRCIAGNALFWFLGALFQTNITLYAKNLLKTSDIMTGILASTVALGMGVGSMIAGRLSGRRVELRLVPIGAAGIALFSVFLGFTAGSFRLTLAALAGLGACAGFFNIPLAAYIQHKSPKDGRGRYLAASNFVSFAAMTLSAPVFLLLGTVMGLNPAQVFLAIALLAMAVLALMFGTNPAFMTRFLMYLFTHIGYRVRVTGELNIPETGGALIVCNHISLWDVVLLQTAVPRPVRYLTMQAYAEASWLRSFCRWVRCIPIDRESGTRSILRSLKAASQALREGDLVVIFAEGMISRSNMLLEFERGMELITRGTDAPVIPMCLSGLWDSRLSHRDGAPALRGASWRRLPVAVHIGQQLPSGTPSPTVREHVATLLAKAHADRKPSRETLGTRLLRKAWRHPFRACSCSLETGERDTLSQLCVSALVLATRLRETLPAKATVGVLLPALPATPLVHATLSFLACDVHVFPIELANAAPGILKSWLDEDERRVLITIEALAKAAELSGMPAVLLLAQLGEGIRPKHRISATLRFLFLSARHTIRALALPGTDPDTRCSVPHADGQAAGSFPDTALLAAVDSLDAVLRPQPGDTILPLSSLASSASLVTDLWFPLLSGCAVLTGAPRPGEKPATRPDFLFGRQEVLAALRLHAKQLLDHDTRACQLDSPTLPLELPNAFHALASPQAAGLVAISVPDFEEPETIQPGTREGAWGRCVPELAARIGRDGWLELLGDATPQGSAAWTRTTVKASIDADGFIHHDSTALPPGERSSR
ncbi:MAG: MFS transporter [Lentisphaeria bacterium]|nr:MFS transporter [Lentisphaeria bacterium]